MKKQQDGKKQTSNYKKIQQDLQAFRASKRQEKSKYEIGQQQGTETARDQKEEMELWEIQKKKAEEKKKKESQSSKPGGAAAKSGEQGKIMG